MTSLSLTTLWQEKALNFEKKFGIPLTVTEQQVKKHRESQTTVLRERMVNRINPGIRDLYSNIVQQEGGAGPAVGSEEQRMSPKVFDSYGSY